jgi:monoamine oxidase
MKIVSGQWLQGRSSFTLNVSLNFISRRTTAAVRALQTASPRTMLVEVRTSPIVIVGAGAAGLAAARELARGGRDAVVLEARDRIGGRVFTHREPNSSVPIELGAEFVHGRPPELWKIATAANLQLYEVSERHWYFEKGKVSKAREFWRAIESVTSDMKSSARDQSLKEFLESLPDDEKSQRAKAMLVRYVEGFHAANIERIGIHGLVKANEAADEIDGDKAFRLIDGYDSLMQAMQREAESHGAKLHLNTIVKEIRLANEQIEVSCGQNDAPIEFIASHVIVTLPISLLKNETSAIHFMPELPTDKRTAIENLSMGNVVKINLLFRERFWETVKLWDESARAVDFRDASFFHCPGAPLPTWWTQLPIRAPLLVGWTGGPNAERIIGTIGARRQETGGSRQAAGKDLLLEQALDSLATIFKLSRSEIEAQLAASYVHNWRDDPFTHGAYAYVAVNGLHDQRILANPVKNKLFFAGEATSIGHIGTVHGAIQSGERAARQILLTH